MNRQSAKDKVLQEEARVAKANKTMLSQFKKFELSKSQQQAVQGGASAYGTTINVAKVAVDVLNTTLNTNETTQATTSQPTETQQSSPQQQQPINPFNILPLPFKTLF